MEKGAGEIILYQPNETLAIEVKLDVDHNTVWLTKRQMADLFGRDRTTISRHITNTFQQGEVEPEVGCAFFAHTTRHGAMEGKTQTEPHDRFLVIDDRLYHCGHSLNATGSKLSAIMLMGTSPETIFSEMV